MNENVEINKRDDEIEFLLDILRGANKIANKYEVLGLVGFESELKAIRDTLKRYANKTVKEAILTKKIEELENNLAKEIENNKRLQKHKDNVIAAWYEFYKSCANICGIEGEVEPSIELDKLIISYLKKINDN